MSSNFDKGLQALHQGNLSDAESFFSKAIESDPLYVEAYFNRGKVRRQTGKFTAALNDFHKVLELNPNHNQAKVSIEMIQKILGFRNPDIYNA